MSIDFSTITDGTSNTFLFGERNVPANNLGLKNPDSYDGPVFRGKGPGDDRHSLGWSIRRAGPGYGIQVNPQNDCSVIQTPAGCYAAKNCTCGVCFGSFHPGVCLFAYCDGRVSVVGNNTSDALLGYLAQATTTRASKRLSDTSH